MRHLCTVCVGIVLAVPLAGVGADPPKTAELEKARTLVRALGDKSYRTREQAALELLRMGRSAYVAVEEGTHDRDAEVRARCAKMLPVILDQEIRARLEAFMADTDGKQEHGLPGWGRFRSLCGNTKTARELFSSMIRNSGAAMEEIEVSAQKFAGERLHARVQTLQQHLMFAANTGAGAALSLQDIIQVIFLATKPDLEVSAQAAAIISSFMYQSSFRQGLSNSDYSEIVRKLTIAWFEKRADDSNTAFAIMNLATTNKFPELAAPALKLAANTKVIASARGTALCAIGKLGERKHAKLLEPLVADTTQASSFNQHNIMGTTQVGDIALAQIIHLHGEKPSEFGFFALKTNPNLVSTYYFQGFANDQARKDARKKWQEHLEKLPKK